MSLVNIKKVNLFTLHLVIAFLAFVVPGYGQDSEKAELVTDRPDQTESATIVPKGSVQLETGMLFTSDSYDFLGTKVTNTSFSLPNNLFRIGVHERIELRVMFLEFGKVNSKVGSTSSELGKGLSPLAIGTKIKFFEENGFLPETAILAHTTLPLGGADFKPEKMGYDFRFSMAHTLSDNLALGYNVGAEFEYDALNSEYVSSGVYTLSLGIGITDKFGVYTEFFGDFAKSHEFDAGITYLINPMTQFDLSGGVGLTDEANDYYLSTGITVRLFN